MTFASLGLWSVYLRLKDVYHQSYEHRLRVTNISLAPELQGAPLCSTTQVKFLCNGLLAGISVLTPENTQAPIDIAFPKDVTISIEVDGLTPVSISGIFICSSRYTTDENVPSPIPACTCPNPDNSSSTIPARDDHNEVSSSRGSGTKGEHAIPTAGRTPQSVLHEPLIEDLESGSGCEVQTRSTVSFETKMKDGTGGIIDRFSFEALTCSFQDCTWILPGLCEGLEGMRTGGSRRVRLPPFAPARIKWGDEGMEELRGETLVLEIMLRKVEQPKAE